MKKFFARLFIMFGVIFFVLVLVVVELLIGDPLHLKASLPGSPSSGGTTGTTTDKNSLLSESQEKTLETIGVDPAKLPSSITPAQEACFTEKLGAERVAEIKAGGSPTPTEFYTAKSCI